MNNEHGNTLSMAAHEIIALLLYWTFLSSRLLFYLECSIQVKNKFFQKWKRSNLSNFHPWCSFIPFVIRLFKHLACWPLFLHLGVLLLISRCNLEAFVWPALDESQTNPHKRTMKCIESKLILTCPVLF